MDDMIMQCARRGAELRIGELKTEMTNLLLAFPDLQTAASVDGALMALTTVNGNGNGHRRLHWTKRPENAERLKAMHRKAARTRKANASH